MLLPLSGLICGILLGNCGIGFIIGAALILAGLGVYEIISWKSADPVSTYHLRNWHYAWLIIVFTGTGIIVSNASRPEQLPYKLTYNTVMAYGHVEDVRSTTLGDRVILELTAVMDSTGHADVIKPTRVLGMCRNFTADTDDDVIFPCKLIRITDSTNTFNSGYALRMARKGILYSAIIGDSVKITGHKTSFSGITLRIRNKAEEFIENTSLSKSTQNFLITILLGDRAYLDEDARALFVDGGISHILALSGMHVSIIAGIILWLLFPFNLFGIYRCRYVAAVPILWAYTILTGLSPSTVRAAIMMTVVIICILTERKNSAWNALLLSVFIILLFNPNALYDVGLQLSFVCVASLIFFAGPLNPVDHHEHDVLFTIVASILVTLTATAASWVLSSYYFGIFPTLFIPANLVALPLLPVYIVMAIAYFASVAMGYPIMGFDRMLDAGYSGLISFLSWMRGPESSALHFDVSGLTVVLWLIALAGITIWLHYKHDKRILSAACFIAVAAIVMIPFTSDAQPDGFIIQTSDRPQILVRNGRCQYTGRFESNSVSGIKIQGKNLITADCNISGMSPIPKCDFAIITRSCPNSIVQIDSLLHPELIIVHTSVRRDRELDMIRECDSLHLQIHSLRIDGPLHVYP